MRPRTGGGAIMEDITVEERREFVRICVEQGDYESARRIAAPLDDAARK